MKVCSMKAAGGNSAPNQFIIKDCFISLDGREVFKVGDTRGDMFQSYSSNIAFKTYGGCTYLDKECWDFSDTTGRYRNQFLDEGIEETRKKIKSGEYKLVNLN